MRSPLDDAPMARRCAACLVDLGIAGMLGALAATAAELALASIGPGDALIEPLRKLLLLATNAGYSVMLTAGPRRATFGQRWFGLEVLGVDGRGLSLAEAFARWVAFCAAALPLGAGLLLALGPDRRPFQDRICDSRVAVRPAVAVEQAA
jgi:uncharacterized RDD family membrane protein YckC